MTLRNLFTSALTAYGWEPVPGRSTRYLVLRQTCDRTCTRLTWPDGTTSKMYDRGGWVWVGAAGALRVGFSPVQSRAHAAIDRTRNELLDVGRRLAAGQVPVVEVEGLPLPVDHDQYKGTPWLHCVPVQQVCRNTFHVGAAGGAA